MEHLLLSGGFRGNSDSKSTQLPSIGGLQACLANKTPRGGLEMLAMVSSLADMCGYSLLLQ